MLLDPTPFHHRDLDRDAEEFLESWALEFPRDSHFRIIVHIEKMPAEDPAPLVSEAIRNYFDYKSMLAKRICLDAIERFPSGVPPAAGRRRPRPRRASHR